MMISSSNARTSESATSIKYHFIMQNMDDDDDDCAVPAENPEDLTDEEGIDLDVDDLDWNDLNY
jgi:hypothetical protein